MEELVLVLDLDGTLIGEINDDEPSSNSVDAPKSVASGSLKSVSAPLKSVAAGSLKSAADGSTQSAGDSKSTASVLGLARGRPYLAEFLEFAFARFRAVGIWTAASPEWVEAVRGWVFAPILRRLKRDFDFVWTGDRCRLVFCRPASARVSDDDGLDSEPGILKRKPLSRMWRPTFRARFGASRDTTLIVDDTPTTYRENYGNAIEISTWNGTDQEDDALRRLMRTLSAIGRIYAEAVPRTVRHINKRSAHPFLDEKYLERIGAGRRVKAHNSDPHPPSRVPHRALSTPAEIARRRSAVNDGGIDEHRAWRFLCRSALGILPTQLISLTLDYLSLRTLPR